MIIGLSGYARSGKDESAKALAEIGYERVGFADKLREFLYALNPILPSVSYGQGTREKTYRLQEFIDKYGWDGYKEPDPYEQHVSDEVRQLLQRLGTECGRNLISDTIWIDAALNGKGGDIAVADVRFPNEAQAIVDRGGIIVRIQRPGVGPANAHPSETSLDDWPWDYIVQNDGTLEDLSRKVREVVAIHNVKKIARAARIGPVSVE